MRYRRVDVACLFVGVPIQFTLNVELRKYRGYPAVANVGGEDNRKLR